MSDKHTNAYRDPELAARFVNKIKAVSHKPVRLMEVCGTHTVSIFRNGIRSLLPETVTLISGPGCPVCVTAQGEIDSFIQLASADDVIITTFGDLIRVPGSTSSLQAERANGRDVRIVYSAFDAVEIARQNPSKTVVFPGVGFETTAPTIAASILTAKAQGLTNFCVYSAHKLVPPALSALMAMENLNIDGFLLPGHVSVILGVRAYEPFIHTWQIPCVIGGFEPVDILQAVFLLVSAIETGEAVLENAYPRAVKPEGNPKALETMYQVFEPVDAQWRGLGMIPNSGLKIRDAFASFDAIKRFGLQITPVPPPKGCACGDILTGLKIPPDCPLYKSVCTPANPVGPCMVSSEGTCAAYYRYHG